MNLKGWWQRLCAVSHGPWLLAGILLLSLLSLLWQEGGTAGPPSQQEARLAQVLSRIRGAGRVEAALFCAPQEADTWQTQQETVYTGAVIVAQGAGDVEVRLSLIRAAAALTGLEAGDICILPMEEGGGTGE